MTRVLELRGITKRFPGVQANDAVDFDLEQGEIHAILGENGAGKTTLMSIRYGLIRPDQGGIRIRDELCQIRSPVDALTLGIGMVHQHFMLVPTMTVVQNVVLGQEPTQGPFVSYRDAVEHIKRVSVDFGLDVSPYYQIRQLSVGEQQRVEILKVLYRGADILILDEPTAVLTPVEVEGLFDTLRSMTERDKSIIFISHKLKEVMTISDRVTVLRGGRVQGTLKTRDTNEADLARMMVGRDVVFTVSREESQRGDVVASLRSARVMGDQDKPAVIDVDLDLYAGEIVGVAGVDGNGQSELAEAIAGLRPLSSGSLVIEGADMTASDPWQRIKRGVAYVPADRKVRGVAPDLSLMANSILKNHRVAPFSTRGVMDHEVIREFARRLVREYDIRCHSIHVETGTLSGGNLQKLILARETASRPYLLIAEHPTRGLDVGATENIRRLLLKQRDEGAAILLISADLDEVLAMSDKVVVMFEGRLVHESKSEEIDRHKIGLAMAGLETA